MAIPIIDTHQHLWDLKRFNLPWLTNASDAINRSFEIKDFRAAANGCNVTKSIYMEVDVHPAQQVEEARFAIGLCEDPGTQVSGAVIGGQPHDPGFAEYLKQFAGVRAVKGVRMVLHSSDRPPGLCLTPQFVDSMKRLANVGFTFDLCMRSDELLTGAQLAAKCPQTTFVLDHCGNIGLPARDAAVRHVWREGIKAVAAQPNVVCKISGLIDKTGTTEGSPQDLAGTINFCIDAFTEDRVVFGGDWPVCLLGGSYKHWVDTLKQVVQDRSEACRKKLFHDNAIRVYRLA
ncbi:MAG: amidohydrolase family protein [Planctomycetota bacterium]|nr:amidohydrolase family protein [Planctomycetaceae bacterium]MDQ3333067.1 amidohydrolase family protein [Planctomycetota bacterium]